MPNATALARHVVLVSIDALRPAFFQDERWPAPTLQQFASEGVFARQVRSVFPALTYPAHTTIVTGARPARHGVFHNRPFEPLVASGEWLWSASNIRVPTLWDAVRAHGGTTGSISWPVTVGAAIDWNIPDIWSEKDERTVALVRAHATPPGIIEELERNACGPLRDENFAVNRLTREDRVGAIGAYLFERFQPSLLMMHLISTDHIQHETGRDNPKTRRAVGAADRAVGQVLEVVERVGKRDCTAFVVTGDHGSADVHTRLAPNVWLRQAGLLGVSDWRAVFFASGGSAFLRARDDNPEYACEAKAVIDGLPRAVRALFRVVERAELDDEGADPDSAFALVASPGIAFTEARTGEALRAATGAAHGYDPDEPEMLTGFIGSGAGFRKGAVAPRMRLESVAPVVAHLLGLKFDAPDGVLLPGFFVK
jgi:predicted AlkP superfamily pyrophosphatase or phosphodiesterase